MLPHEIVNLADRMTRTALPEDLPRLRIAVSTQEWDALRDYLAKFEPITRWPIQEREPVTRLVIRDIPIVIG